MAIFFQGTFSCMEGGRWQLDPEVGLGFAFGFPILQQAEHKSFLTAVWAVSSEPAP